MMSVCLILVVVVFTVKDHVSKSPLGLRFVTADPPQVQAAHAAFLSLFFFFNN